MPAYKVALITTDDGFVGLGIRTLSSCLKAEGFDVTLVFLPDASHSAFVSFPWDELRALCKGCRLVGVSFMTHGAPNAYKVAAELSKGEKPYLVAGGPHATFFPDEALRHFDAVCRGEGEDSFLDMAVRLRDNRSIDDIPGIWSSRGSETVKNECVPLRRELDGYPFPDYDLSSQYLLEKGKIVRMQGTPEQVVAHCFTVMGSRGCPHSCAYCSNSSIKKEFPFRRQVRHYSVEYLIRHCRRAREAFPCIEAFWIGDDTFFAKSLEDIREFSRRFKEEVGVRFLILVSPLTFSEEKLRLLEAAGLSAIVMGVQSGSEHTNFDVYMRHVPADAVKTAARILSRHAGLNAFYDIIGMNPYESGDDLAATISLLRDLPRPFSIFHNSLAFYPGTALYETARKEGRDISLRVQHSDERTGFSILAADRMPHKLLHLLLMLMGGESKRHCIGRIPRLLLREKALRFFVALDARFGAECDALVALSSRVVLWLGWGKGRIVSVGVDRIYRFCMRRVL